MRNRIEPRPLSGDFSLLVNFRFARRPLTDLRWFLGTSLCWRAQTIWRIHFTNGFCRHAGSSDWLRFSFVGGKRKKSRKLRSPARSAFGLNLGVQMNFGLRQADDWSGAEYVSARGDKFRPPSEPAGPISETSRGRR